MKPEQAAPILSGTLLFAGMDDDPLMRMAERCKTRRFSRNEYIFHQGDPGDSLFVVAEGLVKVFVISEEGGEMVLATLEPPDTFGELAVIDGGPRSAAAKAIEPTVLLALTRDTFLDLVRENAAVADALYQSLGVLLRRVLEQASDLVFLDLPGRVAKLLLALGEERGTSGGEGSIVLDLQVSQGNLAAMVGGSRPSVNQILKAFENRGYLELQGRQIVIKQPDLLRRRAT